MAQQKRRVFVLTVEEHLFYPELLDSIIRGCPDDYSLSGAAIARPGISVGRGASHLMRLAGPFGILRLARRLIRHQTKMRLQSPWLATVRGVLDLHGVPRSSIHTPNDPSFVAELQRNPPDVIFSAVPHILRSPILSVPVLGCINRHAGLLPGFRGVEPVFQALRTGETHVTVTFHKMTRAIDAGEVLWEHTEPVRPDDTVYALYERLFRAAATGFWPAVRALEAGQGRVVDPDQGAYFSWPTAGQIAEFRRKRHRYI